MHVAAVRQVDGIPGVSTPRGPGGGGEAGGEVAAAAAVAMMPAVKARTWRAVSSTTAQVLSLAATARA